MDELAKVKPDTKSFDELMLNIRNGKIRIPDFQREFVWELSQIINLLDSLYHHYPIGSFLFWETDDEIQTYRRVGEIELQHDHEKSVQYVLDGQQRLTSLFASLVQAKIAHRVNGKKVTKSIQIYFDLDESCFVDNPFAQKDKKSIWKRTVFAAVPATDDYLDFLQKYLTFIDSNNPTKEEALDWLLQWPEMATTRAKQIFGQLNDIRFYKNNGDNYHLVERGIQFLNEKSSALIITLLLDEVEYYSELIPKLLSDGKAEIRKVAEYLSDDLGEQVKPHKMRGRLRWLAGLKLGSLIDNTFLLNEKGREVIEDVYKAKEIAERDRREQEEEKKKRYFSVQQITNLNEFVTTAASLDEVRREKLQTVLRRFTSYPFSVIQVLDQPIETACEIFERINNSGKILNVVDLMVAKSWSRTFNLRERLNEFREELKKEQYDIIPDITVIQCLSAIVKQGVRRKDILEIERNIVEEKWEETLENVRLAIDFLKSNLKVTHAKVLPYNACIVPLAYYFSVSDTKSHDNNKRKQLEQWFWRASASNRYDSAAETKLADDIHDIGRLAKGDQVTFDYAASPLTADRIISQKLNLGSAFCKMLLCILNQKGPREFKDGAGVSLNSFSKFNSAELHHIFPKAYLHKHDNENYLERDSLANIALVKASANKIYSSQAPSSYLNKIDIDTLDGVLKTHFIDDLNKSGLLDNDFEVFVEYRAEKILKQMRKLTGDMTEVEADMEDDELKVIEKFELRLRNLIHEKLSQEKPDYWKTTGTPEFREIVESRINHWINLAPGRNRENVREVDHLQILDYFKVIKSNWSILEPVFHSRKDLEQYLKMISNFRNAVAHHNDIDAATRNLAMGALEWFEKAFANLKSIKD